MLYDRTDRAKKIMAEVREHDPALRESLVREAAGSDAELERHALALLRAATENTAVLEPSGAGSFGIAPGALLKDRYLIIRELSRGGFGVVYLAHDQQLHGKPVVVKLQLETLGDDPWFERKFTEEIRALALIDHPGVVGALDSGKTSEGRPFLVMQYVQGRSLRSVMTPEGMPLDRVANIVQQAGQALTAAHEKRVWHRDLKPENIMLQSLSGGEHVRLIDFGIATIADMHASQLRAVTRIAGSIGYMAPEQVEGHPSAATDIYAFGVIAYEMVTGRKPFVPEDMIQLAILQRAGVRIKPSDLRPGLSQKAQTLILQALSYNPKERPASAAEFGEQLAAAILAGPSESTGSAHTIPGRRKLAVGLAAVIVTALLGTGAWLLHGRSPASPEKSPTATVQPRQSVVQTPERDKLAVELEFWNSIKTENRPDLYREYLQRYPQGQFAAIARIKLDQFATKPASSQARLPAPRASLSLDEYNGPLRGELTWSGRLAAHETLIVQGGQAGTGGVHGDLPRVPVEIQIPPGMAVIEAPSERNHWDRLEIRNDTGGDIKTIAIGWRLKQ
ncbi:MAG TPA: serine/threonine-protein kinase [Bryobacteraceae bacterium]|nr:serine/threonine-protein kinase [Bryobacteraceae bacterium]